MKRTTPERPVQDADKKRGEHRTLLRDAWRRPEHWAKELAGSRRGLWSISVASFLETIIVPIPIEIVLIPFMLLRRDLIWVIALVTTLGCLLASLLGYGVGYFLFESVGRPLVHTMGWEQDLATFQQWFDSHGFWAILAIGVVPIPFQVAMLAAGMSGYPVHLFVLAATIARGIRYFGLGLLVCLFGERALSLWKRNKTAAGVVLLIFIGALVALNILFFGR